MHFQKSKQISESHCGPAVLQMLLDLVGVATTQENITKAANAENTIEEFGLRTDQLGLACARVAAQTKFWYKHGTSLEDIRQVLQMGYVVGVEWQSLFYDSPEEEELGYDYGHYSIILDIDDDKKEIIMADPYKDFIDYDRVFSIDFFEKRWWDTNEVLDADGNKIATRDERVSFFVAAAEKTWPTDLGFTAYEIPEVDLFNKIFITLENSPVFKKDQRLQKIKGLLQGRLRKIGYNTPNV